MICFVGVALSCDRVTEEKIRSYIVEFTEYKTIHLELTEKGNIAMYWRDKGQWGSFSGDGDTKYYDALCEKYNDLNYNKKTRYIATIACREYSSNEIVSISMISNAVFDSDHPAGSTLDDLVYLVSSSPIRFIQSNYKETYNWNAPYPLTILSENSDFHLAFCYNGDDGPVTPHHYLVYGSLSELKKDDFRLLGQGHYDIGNGQPTIYPDHAPGSGYFFGNLKFDKDPDIPGIHELTVSVHLADGRTLTQTIEKNFE